MQPPVSKPPYRSPITVSDTLKELLKDKVVCELGCAEGDNLIFMAKYAKEAIGFEYMKRRYQVAQSRGLKVTVGDYYKDSLPTADIYYFWPDDGEKDSEYLVQKLLQDSSFNGHIIVGADPGFPPEIAAHDRCAKWGSLITVPYNEGPGHRENGIFRLVVINKGKLQRQFTFLLSSPRAGSSCTTGCFELCGVSLGKSVTTVKDGFNPKGYFENQKILTFNDKVLQAIGSNIFTSSPLKQNQIDGSLNFKNELSQIISTEYINDFFFMIKDPRINILQELYLQVFQELGIGVNTVILRRNRENSAKSMNRMAGIGVPRAESVYDLHYQLAKTLCDKLNTAHHIEFEQLLNKPNETMQDACYNLSIPYGVGRHNKEKINQFVERGLLTYG